MTRRARRAAARKRALAGKQRTAHADLRGRRILGRSLAPARVELRSGRREVVEQRGHLAGRQPLIGHPLLAEFLEERDRRPIARRDHDLRRGDPGGEPGAAVAIGDAFEIRSDEHAAAERMTAAAVAREGGRRIRGGEGAARGTAHHGEAQSHGFHYHLLHASAGGQQTGVRRLRARTQRESTC